VAAGLLAGLDADGLVHVLGLTASMGSGVIEANRTGGTVKRMHCGWAAHSALSAVELVRQGFTGPPTVLEGRFGFFQAWLHGRFDPSAITGGLGERWEVPGIFFKPYPANHFTHTGLDAARELRERGVEPSQIRRLTLGVPASVVRTIGEPIEVKRAPETGYMAQFSGPYAVATGLLGGGGLGAGLGDYTDDLARDPARRAIMAKVDVVADAECTKIFPHQFPSVLTATLADGASLTARVMTNRGGTARPLTYDELALKFSDNAGRRLPAAAVQDVRDLVGRLDELPELGPLWSRLALAEGVS
jgi:2-methylcitrate dehydratase PrpD